MKPPLKIVRKIKDIEIKIQTSLDLKEVKNFIFFE